MDYIETFKNLKPNEKYGRKTPHKAVLLLTIMDLYESNEICSNEIKYNQLLIDTFLKVWQRTLPCDNSLFVDAYIPFWSMQNENFWHLVPLRGKEDIFNLLRERQIIPSENKIRECIDYAELDEDLFFLMTLPSGRSSLKRALLENYSALTGDEIGEMVKSKDIVGDKSVEAMVEYKDILSSGKKTYNNVVDENFDEEKLKKFYALDEDVQIQLNIEFYTFLKEHKNERDMFKNLCPTVFDLYDKISFHPVKQGDLASSLSFTYENFLKDLKVNLLDCDATFCLIDDVENAIHQLHTYDSQKNGLLSCDTENHLNAQDNLMKVQPNAKEATSFVDKQRESLPWTENEEELLLLYYEKGKNIDDIARILERSQKSIMAHLTNLGKLNNDFAQEENFSHTDKDSLSNLDYYVENLRNQCAIFNRIGEQVYSTTGKFKIFHGKLYRLNYKDGICFTVKDMVRTNGVWEKGTKKIVAYMKTDLYPLLDRMNYINQVEDIYEDKYMLQHQIRVSGKWYDFYGNFIRIATEHLTSICDDDEMCGEIYVHNASVFVPKGGLDAITTKLCNFYDYLWLMAVIDLSNETQHPNQFLLDELACMMIAEAWCLLNEKSYLKTGNADLVDCIEYLINESKDNMKEELKWTTPKFKVFSVIKDYPMSGIFEDLVDDLVAKAPINVLRIWLKDKDELDLVLHSANYVNNCLYSLHLKKFNSFIEINPIWKKYLLYEHSNLCTFVKDNLVAYYNQ